MIVSRDVVSWVCPADASILDALSRISEHRHGAIFCVEADGRMVGMVTDGDFRRWVISRRDLDVHQSVRAIVNRSPRTAPADADADAIAQLFDDRVRIVPLVDGRGRLVAVASHEANRLDLDGRIISDDQPTLVIAEIGINHNGDPDLAMQLVDQAASAGADCAKFQLRDLGSLYRSDTVTAEDLGAQYALDLLGRFQLAPEDLFRAFDRCRDHGMVPLCTAWDLKSLSRLERYGLAGYKVASADLTNHDLVGAVADTGRPVIMSTGMATESEVRESVQVLQAHSASYALLQCSSTYPAPFKDLNLRYLERLREIGACPVGYSGHERGWHVPMAAVALGARIIEKHLTLDRTMEGNDHKVSLLPEEMGRMITEIRQVEEALGSPTHRTISPGEAMNRVSLAKSLVATTHLEAGRVIAPSHIAVKAPGRGVQPNRRAKLIGRTLTRTVAAGGFFYPSDLEDGVVPARAYRFGRPWGIPVRYHDLGTLLDKVQPDFVEFHLSYLDLDLDPADHLHGPQSCGYTVHSPDLFRSDHILDLASTDDTWWRRSIDELARVLDLVRSLRPFFPGTETPLVITSLGGFTREEPLDPAERPARYDRILSALDLLDRSEVELVAQTLPPFPWYLGGQLHSNLFVDPLDTTEFARSAGIGLCLDVSHSKLACNHRRSSFSEFVEQVGPHIRHLHLVDAEGTDGEGLQIGHGDVDWPVLAAQLNRVAPDAGFIPEIWQGHRNDGEDFWIALDRLEQWF